MRMDHETGTDLEVRWVSWVIVVADRCLKASQTRADKYHQRDTRASIFAA